MLRCVLVGGGIGVGKTTVSAGIADRFDGRHLRVRDLLEEIAGKPGMDRAELQRRGRELDRRTEGKWIAEYVEEAIEHAEGVMVIDAMRTRRQTSPMLASGNCALLFLGASLEERRHRFALSALADPVKRSLDFDAASLHEIEIEALTLKDLADIVLDTEGQSPLETLHDAIERIRTRL